MTGHTHRQKGRNVARLIREGEREARGCPRGTRWNLAGACSPDLTLASVPAYGSPSRPLSTFVSSRPARQIGSACGPRVYLRCSTSRAKYYASVLLCDHPDGGAPLRARAKGLWLRVCLHVGTRRRICYTLVMRGAFAFIEAGTGSDGI